MTEQEVFILSEQAMRQVVDQITDEQWTLPVDAHTSSVRPGIPLRELINYHAYDDIWVPDVLAGKTIEEVGQQHAGDLLGDDPKASYARINEASQQAARDFTDLDKVVHLTYGDFPAREYFKHITTYRGFQSWNIARFIGIDDTMQPELVRGMWDLVMPNVEDWRAMGVFKPAVAVPVDSDQQTKLLAATGFWYTK